MVITAEYMPYLVQRKMIAEEQLRYFAIRENLTEAQAVAVEVAVPVGMPRTYSQPPKTPFEFWSMEFAFVGGQIDWLRTHASLRLSEPVIELPAVMPKASATVEEEAAEAV